MPSTTGEVYRDSCGGREGLVKEGEREVFLASPPVSGALPYTAGERDSNTGVYSLASQTLSGGGERVW